MNRREWLPLAAIVVAGAAVRFATLGHQSYDHDEAVTAWRVLRGDLGGTLHVVATSERSPPLYYLLAWGWAQVFGTGEVGLRSLSALLGVAAVPGAYLAARELASRRTGLIAAALVAFNPYLVWYSQEARSYALLVLFATWGLYFFARCLEDPTRRNLGLWAVACALALCSHYFAAFIVGAEAAWLLARWWPRRAPALAVGAVALVAVALVPLAVAQEGTGRSNRFRDTPLPERAGHAVLNFLASQEPQSLVGSAAVRHFRVAALVVGLILVAVAMVLLLRRASPRERRGGLTAAGVGAATLVVPFALAAAGLDFVDDRNLIVALVPLLIAVAVGLGAARAGRLGAACAGATVLVFLAVLTAVYASAEMQRDDWRAAAAAMGPRSGPRVLVVARNGDEPIAYYRKARELRPPRFRSIRVREIDVLSKLGGVSAPGHGFRLVEWRRLRPCCALWRYRAVRPVTVRPDEVADHRVLHERSSVLVEGARPG